MLNLIAGASPTIRSDVTEFSLSLTIVSPSHALSSFVRLIQDRGLIWCWLGCLRRGGVYHKAMLDALSYTQHAYAICAAHLYLHTRVRVHGYLMIEAPLRPAERTRNWLEVAAGSFGRGGGSSCKT